MKRIKEIGMGVCYYPEHWNQALWEDDLRRMEDCGIQFVRIAEFAWNKFENTEGRFTFDFFDRFLEMVDHTNIKVIFCTPTATPPAWLTEKYPEVLNADKHGMKYHHGARRHYNYNAKIYQEKTEIIVEQLARHYGQNKLIIGWQIDNELNCAANEFYSEADHEAFREFLKNKYETLEQLNDAWGTVFWNQTYTDWQQVYLPRYTQRDTVNPHLKLDSIRFYSESCILYCKLQADILKRYIHKDAFITTNSFFPHIEHPKMVKECLDFISYDSYPAMGFMDGADSMKDRKWSMNLAQVRSTGDEFGIMEQQTGPGGWFNYRVVPAPKPGQIRLWAFQSIANGADFINFFRWRTCTFGTEIYWHGILNYDNRSNQRLQEVKRIGEEIKKIRDACGRKYQAQVAILMDYENEWDGESDIWHGPVRKFSHKCLFQALQEEHIPFDYIAVTPSLRAEDLEPYSAVFAPHITIVKEQLVQILKEYVRRGGAFYTGARSGYKDSSGKCYMADMPALMTDLFGTAVYDFTAVMPNDENAVIRLREEEVDAPLFHDILTPLDEDCIVLGRYKGGYYKGHPACIKHLYGNGAAYYYGSAFSVSCVKELMKERGIFSVAEELVEAPPSCELAMRQNDNEGYLFILNYEDQKATLMLKKRMENMWTGKTEEGQLELKKYGVLVYKYIVEKDRNEKNK